MSPRGKNKLNSCQIHPVKDCDNCEKQAANQSTCRSRCGEIVLQVIVSLFSGLLFGWMLQKSTVYKPMVIRNQFLFKEFVMLKAFLSALMTGQLILLLLSCIPATKDKFEKAKNSYSETLTHKGIFSSLIGGLLLGAGMAVAAGCPGMVLAQVGSVVPNSAYTILGGILSCFVYGFLHQPLSKLLTPKTPYKSQYIPELLKIPYWALALPCILLCLAAVVLMEIFHPDTTETHMSINKLHFDSLNYKLDSNNSTNPAPLKPCQDDISRNWFTQEMWSPSVCGCFIGLLQFPLVLFLSDTLGSSSGYMTIASQWVITKSLRAKFPYFAAYRGWSRNFWMVALLFGAIGGALAAAATSCSIMTAPGVPWWQGLIGGFLMLFGSRMAAGCTSGHGISGAALITSLSWLAVPAMFAGGIATTFILQVAGQNLYTNSWQPS